MTRQAHPYLRAGGDVDELGVSFNVDDIMRQYIRVIFTEGAFSCYTTLITGATIRLQK